MNVTTAADFLRAGLKHMEDRAQTYDKPEGERSMRATVHAFQQITGIHISEEQGWLFMATLKAVRSQQGGYRADSYEDGAAYFALAGEAASKYREKSSAPETAPGIDPDFGKAFKEAVADEWKDFGPGNILPMNLSVEVETKDGRRIKGVASNFNWITVGDGDDIIRYRVLK